MAYLLVVIGEMCIGPVAYAAVTRWAPPYLGGMAIGAWCLSDAAANYTGGLVGGLAERVGTAGVVAGVAAGGAVAALLLVVINRRLSALAGEARNVVAPSCGKAEA